MPQAGCSKALQKARRKEWVSILRWTWAAAIFDAVWFALSLYFGFIVVQRNHGTEGVGVALFATLMIMGSLGCTIWNGVKITVIQDFLVRFDKEYPPESL